MYIVSSCSYFAGSASDSIVISKFASVSLMHLKFSSTSPEKTLLFAKTIWTTQENAMRARHWELWRVYKKTINFHAKTTNKRMLENL